MLAQSGNSCTLWSGTLGGGLCGGSGAETDRDRATPGAAGVAPPPCILLASNVQANNAVEVARGLMGLHGTDPASVFLAVGARMRAGDPAVVERALYEERSLVRMLGMRRTMFLVPVELALVVQAACTNKIAMRERRRLMNCPTTSLACTPRS